MPNEPQRIGDVLRGQFAAVGNPAALSVAKLRLGALLSINADAARNGRGAPGGDVVFAIGSEGEVDAALGVMRGAGSGGAWAVEYSAREDAARVVRLDEMLARGREAVRDGCQDAFGWYPVEMGSRELCEAEATRLRRVRAGQRSFEKGRGA